MNRDREMEERAFALLLHLLVIHPADASFRTLADDAVSGAAEFAAALERHRLKATVRESKAV